MANKQVVFLGGATYLLALGAIIMGQYSRVAEFVVHSPLLFLNLILTMLLISAGQQLYQKNF